MWLAILIYLIGYVVSYINFRRVWVMGFLGTDYTVGDRWFNLFISLFSWVSVLASFIYYLIVMDYPNKNKKANW